MLKNGYFTGVILIIADKMRSDVVAPDFTEGLQGSEVRSGSSWILESGGNGTLRENFRGHFRAQHQERAARFLAEMLSEVDEDDRGTVIGHEREIIAVAIDRTLQGFVEGGGLGLSFEQMLRRTLNEILRTIYNVKGAVYRPYASPNAALRKGPSHDDQLLRNRELVDAVALAKENVELGKVVLEHTRTLLHSQFPAEAFCVEDPLNLGVNARQVSDLVDNFYLWFLEQMGEMEMLVGYLYVFGGLDAKAVVEKVKSFEEKDFAPEEGEVPPEGQELMGSYGLDAAAIEASYARIKAIFETNGGTYLARFLVEVSLQDTDSLDLIENWNEIRRRRDRVFATVEPDGKEKRGYRRRGMELSAMNVDCVERREILIPETEWAICLGEIDLMRLQRGDLSARNRVLVRILRLIGSMCRKSFADYWLNKCALSDAVLDLQQELSVIMMEKIAMYDPTKCRLSTYMTRWISSSLWRIVGFEKLVPLPVWAINLIAYCRRHSDLSDEEIHNYFVEKGNPPALETIARLRRGNFSMVHLDASIESHDSKDDGKSKKTIGDLLAVSRFQEEELPAAVRAYRDSIVRRALALLPPRHAYVLIQRYVLGIELQKIADDAGVSRQCIEQVELYALQSLRMHTEIEDLKSGDRTVQKGLRARKAHEIDKNPINYVFLILDEIAWVQWCARQTDISEEQMLWFRLYLGFEESSAYGRLQPHNICKVRWKEGLAIDRFEVYRVIRLLRDRLQKDLAALPEEKRFVRSFSRYEMFANAGALLNNLRLTE